MDNSSITRLLNELSQDWGSTVFYWQLLALSSCLLLALLLARYVRRFFSHVDQGNEVFKIGVESFSPVLWPALALILLFFSKLVLGKYGHTSLLKLFIPILVSFALIRFSFYVFRRAFVRGGAIGNALVLFEKVFATLVWLALVLHFTGTWDEILFALDETTFLLGKNKVSVLAILQALASVALTVVVALWLSAMLEARLLLLSSMHTSLQVALSRLGRAIFILLAILISLSLVGIDLTVLSVFGGALGVGLGLGLQRITSSYFAGFIILLDRSISIGDMIHVDKYSGKVTQINTRYTVLKGLDGIESIIPNEMLVSNPVQNLSLTDRAVVITTEFVVSFATDLDALLPKLAAAVTPIPRVSSAVEVSAYLLRFAADGFELRVAFWIDDPENGKTNITSEVNRTIWTVLKENNVDLPYPQREVRIFRGETKSEIKPA